MTLKERLFEHAENGDIREVDKILKIVKNVNIKNSEGHTLLRVAISEADLKLFRYLIHKGADVNIKSDTGTSNLHMSCFYGELEMTDLLLKNGAKISDINGDGLTVIECIFQSGNYEMVKLLMRYGLDLKSESVKLSQSSNNLVHCAVLGENIDLIKLALKYSDINAISLTTGNTPLIVALNNEDYKPKIINFLLDSGANISVNIQNKIGMSPLHYAAFRGHLDGIKLLRKYGANENLLDKGGRTYKHMLSDEDNIKLIELMSMNRLSN